jgi:hypothetical protein
VAIRYWLGEAFRLARSSKLTARSHRSFVSLRMIAAGSRFAHARKTRSFVFFPKRLDLDIDAGRKIELHQRIDRLLRGLQDIEQALVRADLKLLA